jgi:hypothetical protein
MLNDLIPIFLGIAGVGVVGFIAFLIWYILTEKKW